jgi:hypothetical protein
MYAELTKFCTHFHRFIPFSALKDEPIRQTTLLLIRVNIRMKPTNIFPILARAKARFISSRGELNKRTEGVTMSARQGHKKSIIVVSKAPQQAAAPSRVARASRRSPSLTRIYIAALTALLCFIPATTAFAQDAPYYSPEQLDHLVSRVALYPDPLLAQVLAAATFPDEISDAARWADEHRGMNGGQLADRIQDDQLPWDPSVQALLPFPNVLDSMASDMHWTEDLGNAFLANQQEVMYAVQRMRQRARDYGYLRSGPEIVVAGGPYITILPARPDYVVVPYYDPVVVYARPRPGFFIGAAIGFRFGVTLGAAYRPWGWGYNRIAWNERVVVINNTPWHRTWVNRTVYVHPYTVRRVVVHDRVWNDRHEAMERDREHFAHEHDRGNSYYAHERNEERKEAHRDRVEDRHEEHREAVRQEEHHEAIRDARRDEHREPVREAHNDVGRVERHDAPHVEHHDDRGRSENHGGGPAHGNGNGNHDKKDHDDKGHNR